MNRNKFSKVSFDQYCLDNIRECSDEQQLKAEWDQLVLPVRKTRFSAGYDFHAPFSFTLSPNQTILIPTGIRCEVEKDKFLQIVPRSGLGFKYRLQFDNVVAIIDSDYADSANEGHIMLKLSNCSFDQSNILQIKQGEGICQGIILKYCLTEDDDLDYKPERNGGLGSTSK